MTEYSQLDGLLLQNHVANSIADRGSKLLVFRRQSHQPPSYSTPEHHQHPDTRLASSPPRHLPVLPTQVACSRRPLRSLVPRNLLVASLLLRSSIQVGGIVEVDHGFYRRAEGEGAAVRAEEGLNFSVSRALTQVNGRVGRLSQISRASVLGR